MELPITPSQIRYIKLGPGGAWEAASLDGNRIDWGNENDPHDAAVQGDWDLARQIYVNAGLIPATATGFVRELREFYTLGPDTLWITFARGHLWWAFSEPIVKYVGGRGEAEGSRHRPVIGSWRNADIHGQPLPIANLSSKLTQRASYRRTICGVAASDYLLRKINGEAEPIVAAAREAQTRLVNAAEALIKQLHWADFELLVDLIFSSSGWRRVSALGGTMKDIDLLVEEPLIKERASVQVKSSADQNVFDASVAAFDADDCRWRCNFPHKWVLSHFRCRRHAMIRARSRSRPARPYMERLMSFSLLILPSTGPVLQGSVSAARTASISRSRPRANDPMALPSAWTSQGSSSVDSRPTRMSWNRRARSAASAMPGEAARTASTKRLSSARRASRGALRSRAVWRDDGGFQRGSATDGRLEEPADFGVMASGGHI